MIYLDANVLIRLIEGDPAIRMPIESRLESFRGIPGSLLTSRLSWLECRVKPMRMNDTQLIAIYDQLFAGPELVMLEVTSAVIERAAELRATQNFKTPDAIHLASAIIAGANTVLTGDKQFARCPGVAVEVM